jgi:hypothetical protein
MRGKVAGAGHRGPAPSSRDDGGGRIAPEADRVDRAPGHAQVPVGKVHLPRPTRSRRGHSRRSDPRGATGHSGTVHPGQGLLDPGRDRRSGRGVSTCSVRTCWPTTTCLGTRTGSSSGSGRVHRIGQTEVCHMWNLVAYKTRESQVYRRLFDKLSEMRDSLADGAGALRFLPSRRATVSCESVLAAPAISLKTRLRSDCCGSHGGSPRGIVRRAWPLGVRPYNLRCWVGVG